MSVLELQTKARFAIILQSRIDSIDSSSRPLVIIFMPISRLLAMFRRTFSIVSCM